MLSLRMIDLVEGVNRGFVSVFEEMVHYTQGLQTCFSIGFLPAAQKKIDYV